MFLKSLFVVCLVAFAASSALAGGWPSPPPVPNLSDPLVGVSGPPTVRDVVARTGVPSIISGSATQAGSRTWEVSYVPTSALEVCIGNWYTPSHTGSPGELTTGGTETLRASIEYPHQVLAAAASWTTSSTQITMGVSNPGWIVSGTKVWDYTSNQNVGTVSSYSGTTLTLQAAAANASTGSADNLSFGNFVPLTWSGSTTSPAFAQLTTNCSDLTPLGYTLPAFAKFRLNLDFNMGTGGKVVNLGWSNSCDRANGDEYNIGGTAYGNTLNDFVIAGSAVQCYQPLAIMALSNRAVWGLTGDSTALGTNDYGGDPGGGRGLYMRALASLGPVCNMATNGDRASYYANPSYSTLRTAMLGTCGITSDLLTLGVNDFFSGSQTPDQVITARATIRAAIQAAAGANVHVFDTTVTPSTTDATGYFEQTSTQAPSATNANYNRTEFNDFMRGSASPTTTCTLTNSSTALTACSNLFLANASNGMTVTSTTSGIPGSTTVTGLNQMAGTGTLSAAFTGTTTVGASVTFAWPATTNTFPTSSAGLVDIAKLVEGSPNVSTGPIINGGVWLPGYAQDGLHCDHLCDMAVEPLVANMLANQR